MNVEVACVGIDLAWGGKARTGLARLDSTGRLVDSTSVVTDEEIDAFIAANNEPGRTIAAIDAPLIVVNETGQRPCEREISKKFGKYHASAHTSNLKRSHFNPKPRGLRLAHRWNWSVDPGDRLATVSCAIEVYPHPAMVSLFNLDRIIPYKGKRKRSVPQRQVAFERLFNLMNKHLDGLLHLTENARWIELHNQATTASRQADLDRVEDEVDAIFCAYLAWLWGQQLTDLRVFGDGTSGYIVSFPAP